MNNKNKYVSGCDIGEDTNIAEFTVLDGCNIGSNCQIWRFTNLYGCRIGDRCMIGSLVEIQSDVDIGDDCRIQSHSFICSRVTIENNVFVSHGVKFVNDLYPPSGTADEWQKTVVREGASIGTNATLLPVEIGENALVGAGAVVIDDVPANAVVVGNPAEVIDYRK